MTRADWINVLRDWAFIELFRIVNIPISFGVRLTSFPALGKRKHKWINCQRRYCQVSLQPFFDHCRADKYSVGFRVKYHGLNKTKCLKINSKKKNDSNHIIII